MHSIIKTGICSFGMSGKIFHAPFIQAHPGFELTGIVERNKEESRKDYPGSKLYRSVEEMIADNTIELVVVNTPVQLHYPHARAALQAGKHVIVEKPFTIDTSEAEELDALAKEKNLLLIVYQNRRYDGDYRAVKEVVDNKLLGELVEVEIRFDRYRVELSGKAHKESAIPGSGTLHDLGAHLIDQAVQLFGFPEAIFADLRILRPDSGSNDYFELLLYYNKLRVRLKSTVMARESYWAYIFHGTKGSYLQQRSDLQEEALVKGLRPSIESWCPPAPANDGLLHTEKDGVITREERLSTPGNYMGFYDDVYKAIAKKSDNPVPAKDVLLNMRIIDAAFVSSAEQRVVRF